MSDIMNNIKINTDNIFIGGIMKKIFSVFFLFLTILAGFGLYGNAAINKARADEIEHKCKSEILLDADSGTIVYSYNEKERLPIASMCKIMTLLLCFEEKDSGNISFDEKITVSAEAAGMGGSQVFLEANADYPISDLIKSITVASANDACVAMAERICGSESVFVERMNEKAKTLGMENTVFVNCTGLPKAGQFSCAKDVSIMFAELLKHKDYFEYSGIWMDEISHPKGRKTEISNTNKLIKFYSGCDSGKTGYTSEAGHCLAASAKRDGMRLISVVISAPDGKTRFAQASSLFNYGFANYTSKLVVDSENPLDIQVFVEGGKQIDLSVSAEKPVYIFSKKNEKRVFEFNFSPSERVKAPVYKGDIVGKLSIFENGIGIACVNVIARESIEKKTYFDELGFIIENWQLVS